jgi:hypothetical protein
MRRSMSPKFPRKWLFQKARGKVGWARGKWPYGSQIAEISHLGEADGSNFKELDIFLL